MRIIASRDGTHMLCHPASLRNRVFSHAPPLQAAMHGSLRSLRLELAAHHWSASRKLRLSPAARGVNALHRLQFPRTFALARPAKACAPGSRRSGMWGTPDPALQPQHAMLLYAFIQTRQHCARRVGASADWACSEPTHGRLLLAFQHKPGCRSFRSPPIVIAAGQNRLISDSDSISAPVFLVQRTSPSATQVRSEPPSRPRRGPRWLRRVWTPTLTVNGRRPNCRFHPMIAFARFDIGDTSRGGFDKFPCRRPGPKNCTDFRESGPGRSCLLGSDDIRQIPASQSSTTT